jgi:glyoxylase-like metal-dependent hydrolase (beta-lactamase superfamily II)
MSKPVYKINVLHIANTLKNDASFVVNKYSPGKKIKLPTYSYLITGEGIEPMLVDTGIKESMPDIMSRVGMGAEITEDMKLEAQLAKFGYKFEDIKYILHTHLHIDHAGNDDYFTNAKIIMPRKELMFSVADIMDAQYPPEYITYLVEQLHVPGKIRLIDNDLEIAPGITLEITDAHTWGSMNIKVNTKKGLAIICGDVIYDSTLQCRKNEEFPEVEAHNAWDIQGFGDRSTGNYWNLWAAKAGVVKVMTEADVLLPIHDKTVVEKYGYEI